MPSSNGKLPRSLWKETGRGRGSLVLRAQGDEVDRYLRDCLLDEEQVRKTLATRSNLSAHGVDGMGYAVWKTDSGMTSQLITRTIKLMLKYRQFPESVKEAKTILLHKGGEQDDPKSWRPITIMSTLYRLLTAHMAHSLQVLNSRHRFISHQQKGFTLISLRIGHDRPLPTALLKFEK